MKRSLVLLVAIVCSALCGTSARALPRIPLPEPHPVQVLLLSDLHFDPFRDPAKVPALRAAAVEQWSRILSDPDSQTQAASFAALQKACKARGVDSSWSLLKNTLHAARMQQPTPLFVGVDGDLLAHNFDCRLRTLDPAVTADEISEFAEKTIDFLASQMRESFAHSPVYLALGNNDSGCSNYHQDTDSPFVRNVERSIAGDFSRRKDAAQILPAFSPRGDYSVLLPRSMHDTRLIVLQNVFSTPTYGACGGKTDGNIVASQMDWLRRQLDAARALHQKVWVMAHIPPGVDTYATYHRFFGKPDGLCSVQQPVMLQSSDELVSLLTQYAGMVRLALFAHTHMDEIKLLHGPRESASIPAKFIPSISPVNGNAPAFMLATVQPRTATMLDYSVYTATDASASTWKQEYSFRAAYDLPDFSARSVAQLSAGFTRDRKGVTDSSQAYQRWFSAGDDGTFARSLHSVWPAYACSVGNDDEADFHQCVCPGKPADLPAPGE